MRISRHHVSVIARSAFYDEAISIFTTAKYEIASRLLAMATRNVVRLEALHTSRQLQSLQRFTAVAALYESGDTDIFNFPIGLHCDRLLDLELA